MAALDAPLVTQADLDAWKASYQKAQADRDASLAAAQKTGLSDYYVPLYGGDEIVPGMTQNILSNLGIENPYVPVYTLRGSANKGGSNANERMSFAALPDTQYRIVDKNTGQTMTATTPEEIKALAETANAMSKSGGINANFQVQSGQGDKFSTIYEDAPDIDKFNKLAATALPIAVSMIPGLQGVGAVLAGAGSGAASAAMTGGNPLKGALTGGLTAAGTQFLGPIVQSAPNAAGKVVATNLGRSIGAGIGATAGGVATGQPIDKALLKGAIAGGTTYLGGELFGGEDKLANTVAENNRLALANLDDYLYNAGVDASTLLGNAYVGQGAFAPPGSPAATPWAGGKVPSYSSSGYTVNARVPSATPGTFTVVPAASSGPATVVTGTRNTATEAPGAFTVVPAASSGPETVVTGARETAPPAEKPTVSPLSAKVSGPETVVTGTRETAPPAEKPTVTPSTSVSGPETVVTGTRETAPPAEKPTVTPPVTAPGEIVVTAKKPAETTSTAITIPGDVTVPQDIIDLANKDTTTADDKNKFDVKKALALLALLGGGSGGGGGTGTGTGTGGKFQDIFTKKLPTPGEGGALKVSGLKGPTKGLAGTFSARPVTDWYRFGMGPAMDIPAGTDLSGATSPYAGYGPGTLGQETFKAVSGIPEQPTGMYAGGSMGYSRGSSRESFAVEGPGTGRSDDIPAVLSDGEYVIDAETVALLGDGSSKAGAKRLDELRVNLRKHKGRNLAKGKFSVNAKRPEKYLSGGRA